MDPLFCCFPSQVIAIANRLFSSRHPVDLPTPPVAGGGPGVGPGYNTEGYGQLNNATDQDEHPSSALERELAGGVGM